MHSGRNTGCQRAEQRIDGSNRRLRVVLLGRKALPNSCGRLFVITNDVLAQGWMQLGARLVEIQLG